MNFFGDNSEIESSEVPDFDSYPAPSRRRQEEQKRLDDIERSARPRDDKKCYCGPGGICLHCYVPHPGEQGPQQEIRFKDNNYDPKWDCDQGCC